MDFVNAEVTSRFGEVGNRGIFLDKGGFVVLETFVFVVFWIYRGLVGAGRIWI
jgi:hypothetical protein